MNRWTHPTLTRRETPMPPEPTHKNQHEDADRQTDEKETAGDVDLKQEGDDRDDAEEPDAGIHDPDILAVACPDHAVAAGV